MKHVCAESYAKEKQFDDEIDDRDKLDESSLSMEILIWASSRWLKTVIMPIDSVIWGHYKPVSIQLKVDFRG